MTTHVDYERQVDEVRTVIDKYFKGKPGIKTIVEIGARDCGETVAFARYYPGAIIHAFECNPQTLPLCRERAAQFPNIVLHEQAVLDAPGTLSFYAMESDPGSSSFLHHKSEPQRKVEVRATTLAHEFKAAPEVLWLDTQGSEIKILKGAGALLPSISLIHTEIYFKAAYDGQPLYKDIREFLNDEGFDLLKFSSRGRDFADAIFINRRVYARKTPQWVSEASKWAVEQSRGFAGKILRSIGLLK